MCIQEDCRACKEYGVSSDECVMHIENELCCGWLQLHIEHTGSRCLVYRSCGVQGVIANVM